MLQARRILIVDDTWDSGKTIMAVKKRVVVAGGLPTTAVLHYKPGVSLFSDSPDYFVETTGAWIVYPWETSGEAE